MAKNFEVKALETANEEFLVASNKHGEYALDIFARNIAYVFRVGRFDMLNDLWKRMENGGDKLQLGQCIATINSKGLAILFKGDDENVALIKAAGGVMENGRLNVFRVTETALSYAAKDDSGATTSAQLFRRALLEKFTTDEEMAQALIPVMTAANDSNREQAARIFDSVDYLKRVINTIANKVDDVEKAKSLANDLNKIIKVHFGKAQAMSDSAIDEKIAGKMTEAQKKEQEALELVRKMGYDIKAPKPSVVVDHEEKPDNGQTKVIEPPAKGREGLKATG